VQTEQVFTKGSASVAAARRFVARTLTAWGQEHATWDAQLLVSELATNAVLHAGTAFTVRLALTGTGVRLEVDDGVTRAPRERHYGPDATTGRGVGLVATVSEAWGVSMRAGGKSVWCELGAPHDPGAGLREHAADAPDLDAFLVAADWGDDGPTALAMAA
jgi:anti-sigma regulatory factor (Ser/Thr protein kinase)